VEIILGIDPGSVITGYGVIRIDKLKPAYIASGCIRVAGDNIAAKLQQIFHSLREVITQYVPTEIAIEQVFMHRNPGSALKLGQARGGALVAAALDGQPVFEYSAKQIKQAVVGYGAADKVQVQKMVQTLLSLSAVPQADAADALAVALCHTNTRHGLQGISGATGTRHGRLR
jgi:crossover junction endodeoxyribonuclease RuvC